MNTLLNKIDSSIVDVMTTETGSLDTEKNKGQLFYLKNNLDQFKQIELIDSETVRYHHINDTITDVNPLAYVINDLMQKTPKFFEASEDTGDLGYKDGFVRRYFVPHLSKIERIFDTKKTQKTTAQTPVYLQSAADFWSGLFERSDADLKEIYTLANSFSDKMSKSDLLSAAEKIKKMLISEDQIAAHAKLLADEKGAHEIATICGLELSPTIELVNGIKHYSALLTLSQYDDNYDLIRAQVNVISDNKEGRLIKLVFSLK